MFGRRFQSAAIAKSGKGIRVVGVLCMTRANIALHLALWGYKGRTVRIKKVNRYYCEFCGKSNCSAPSISKHEKRCTMNPHRYCGMHYMFDLRQPSIPLMLLMLPEPSDFWRERTEYGFCEKPYTWGTYEDGLEAAVKQVMPRLREFADNCPACIMTALRLKGIPVSLTDLDFKQECEAWWATFNEDSYRPGY